MPNHLGYGKHAKSQFIRREVKHLMKVKHYPQKRAVAASLSMYRKAASKRRGR